jgi:hypothetical protein
MRVWLMLFTLAGCAASRPGDSPEAVCRRQAYDDPAVKRLTIENLGSSSADADAQFEYDKALRDATQTCLRQKGIQVRGGVEPVRPQ